MKTMRWFQIGLTSVALMVSGCQTTGLNSLGQLTQGSNDACSAERQAFENSDSYFTENILKGALIGAVGGAAVGFLAGRLMGVDSRKTAVLGAVAGGGAGAISGYYEAKAQNAGDAAALAGQIHQDVETEGAQIDRAVTTYVALKGCRYQQAELIKGDFQAGRITRDEASQKLIQQRDLYADELEMAKAMNVRMKKRQDEFLQASVTLVNQHGNGDQGYTEWKKDQPAGTVYTVKNANVRSAPSASSAKVDMLVAGTAVPQVAAVGEDKNWVKVRLAGGRDGYIWRPLVQDVAPSDIVQTIDPNPIGENTSTDQVAYATKSMVTETLPDKRKGFESEIEGENDSSVAFMLDEDLLSSLTAKASQA